MDDPRLEVRLVPSALNAGESNSIRVVTGQGIPGKPGKVRESEKMSRKSGNSHGILLIL